METRQKVYVLRAQPGSAAKYAVTTERGDLIFYAAKLSDISDHYNRSKLRPEIVRDLTRTYQPPEWIRKTNRTNEPQKT